MPRLAITGSRPPISQAGRQEPTRALGEDYLAEVMQLSQLRTSIVCLVAFAVAGSLAGSLHAGFVGSAVVYSFHVSYFFDYAPCCRHMHCTPWMAVQQPMIGGL
jgi:hypothetical protein